MNLDTQNSAISQSHTSHFPLQFRNHAFPYFPFALKRNGAYADDI
ncbi:MAG TPA: hypothetical protein VI306_22205 [Pyrinomonadaceae bacterium]